MTRINAGIPPAELCDQHCNGEKFEITRIPNTILRGKAKTSQDNIPETFSLSTGHVKFFYNKILYLKKRYLALCQELKYRGFIVNIDTTPFDQIEKLHPHLFNDWEETDEASQILRQRIDEKLKNMKRVSFTKHKIPESIVL
jgi:deoxyribonuclease (pyrimidine dimer)